MTIVTLNGMWGLGWDDALRKVSAEPLPTVPDQPYLAQATVPGEVHLDLLTAGLIPDPNLGLGTLAGRWVDDTTWWYHRDVVVDALPPGTRAWLRFAQLDLVAHVFVNGQLVGEHRNAFRPFSAEVTAALREGSNHIAVKLEARIGGIDKQAVHVPVDDDWNRHKRPWNRKPSYQWGWDWSSRYLNVGIEGDASLVLSTTDLLVGRAVPLVTVTPDLTRADVRARIEVDNVGPEPVPVTLVARVAGEEARIDATVAPGAGIVEVSIPVADPELWWPSGQGPQALHELDMQLIAAGVDEHRSARVGFRRIDIDQSPHPVKGNYFTVRVNNRPVFCRGGNTAPVDTIPCRAGRDRYEKLIALAVESNFNFLRVNGVGLYESDDFYELCDEAGLMVWQDLTFSCSWYPANDRAFMDDVQAEVTWQVRRLAAHPSLTIWCGQNESEWQQRTDDDIADIVPDYHLFHLLVPAILETNDPYTYYAPCSPHSPGTTAYPNVDYVGDQHPWHIGMGNWDIRDYRASEARFSTEGGILGPGSLPTLREIIHDHGRPVTSPGWYTHDNWIAQVKPGRQPVPDEMLLRLMGVRSDELTLEEYAYWGGLVQSEGLREYVENYRRRWPDCGAAVFWAFNDSWPTTRSWTTVDYYQRRTPGFWAVRRAMAPVTVIVAGDEQGVEIYGVNDTPADVGGDLEWGFFGTHGGVTSHTARVTVPAGSSTLLRSLDGWQGDPASSIAFARLRREGLPDARGRLMLPLYLDVDWAPASPQASVASGIATFTSDVFALGVCLDLEGERPLYDNMFDLWPGMPYSIPWPHAEAPTILSTARLPWCTALKTEG